MMKTSTLSKNSLKSGQLSLYSVRLKNVRFGIQPKTCSTVMILDQTPINSYSFINAAPKYPMIVIEIHFSNRSSDRTDNVFPSWSRESTFWLNKSRHPLETGNSLRAWFGRFLSTQCPTGFIPQSGVSPLSQTLGRWMSTSCHLLNPDLSRFSSFSISQGGVNMRHYSLA